MKEIPAKTTPEGFKIMQEGNFVHPAIPYFHNSRCGFLLPKISSLPIVHGQYAPLLNRTTGTVSNMISKSNISE